MSLIIQKIASLFFLTSLFLSTCQPDVDTAQGKMDLDRIPLPADMPAGTTPSVERSPSTKAASDVAEMKLLTDKGGYVDGETLILSIANGSLDEIQFMGGCTPNLCLYSVDEWICVERECDGQPIILAPEQRLALILDATKLAGTIDLEVKSRYKLDYQFIEEDANYFAYSNEFTIQNTTFDCQASRKSAIEKALSRRYRQELGLNRMAVSWQPDSQTCLVDFAWKNAESIRPGFWSEGYSVVVDAVSGNVLEDFAYER